MDVEERLRDFLRREADGGVVPPELFGRIAHRARIRRRVTALMAGVALVALTAGSIAGIRAGVSWLPTARPAAPGPALTPIPDPGDQQVVGPGTVIATGEVDGKHWNLVAYQSDSGLCVDLHVGQGASGGCGAAPTEEDVVFGQGSVSGLDRMSIHGQASKQVASVEVRPSEGELVTTGIIPDPAGFGVNFFVLFVPLETTGELVALDAAGNVLARHQLHPPVRAPSCCREDVLDEQEVVVYYPLDWVRANEPLMSGVEGVQEIFSVGTFALTPGPAGCEDLPGRAVESMEPADALVTLQEVSTQNDFGPRPTDFGSTEGNTHDPFDCLANVDRLSMQVFTFSDEGRDFRSYVVFGSEAPEDTKRSAWQVLERFLVCDPTSPPGDCL